MASAQDAKVAYLTNDHLGSPRINTDPNGNVTARHDYPPFGEEIASSKRGVELGYAADWVRKQFTGYERDDETNLDFAEARMYSTSQGRFNAADPLLSSGTVYAPQTWNRYAYALNNPVKFIDPTGLFIWHDSLGGSASDDQLKKLKGGQKIIDRRNEIRNAMADAVKGANSDKLAPDQQAAILRGANAFGGEGKVNGVTVGYGKVEDGAAAETKYSTDADGKVMAFSTDLNGTVTANISVTFGEGKTITGDTVAHEGSHTADRQDLGKAFERALQGSDVNLQPEDLPENVTKYETELRAYRVSSYLNQATNTTSAVWNKGWNAADRDKAIRSLLKSSKLYKLTPETPGPRIYTEKP